MVNIFKKSLRSLAMPLITVIALILITPYTAVAATINVQVDRNPVTIDESFRIIFESDESNDNSPDFGPLLDDFEILSRSQSSNMQFINGNLSQQTRWTLLVMAKRSGELTIPPIRIGNDTSPAKRIRVNKSTDNSSVTPDNSDVFIDAKVDIDSAYVQQQILYTIRFYRAVNIKGATMSEPDFNDTEVLVEKLGDDNSFEMQRSGRRYVVIERKYALFPQQSGKLEIEPITLDIKLPAASRGSFDPFGRNSTTKRLKSKAINLTINPIPASMQNIAWLPTKSLQLTESWSQEPSAFIVGEPITRTLTLKGDGLTAAQLPALTMNSSDDFKAYPDQPRLNNKYGSPGVSGTRQEKIVLIPTQAGTITLPPIKIQWWNINTDQMEIASLPERTIHVNPGATNQPPQALPATTAHIGSDSVTAEDTNISSGFYSKLSIVLGLGWLLTVLGWLIQKRNKSVSSYKTQPINNNNHTESGSLRQVKRACYKDDPEQTKTALLNWAQGYWSHNSPTNLYQISSRLDKNTSQEIEKLNRALYSTDKSAWQGKELWQFLSQAVKNKPLPENRAKTALLPLYP